MEASVLDDKDKKAVEVLRTFAEDFIALDGMHGPLYQIGGTRLYVIGIVRDTRGAATKACQVLVLSDVPVPGDELPDIPIGCEPRLCVVAVLRRQATDEERMVDEQEGETGAGSFTFELLELKGRSDTTLFFAGSGIRSSRPVFL